MKLLNGLLLVIFFCKLTSGTEHNNTQKEYVSYNMRDLRGEPARSFNVSLRSNLKLFCGGSLDIPETSSTNWFHNYKKIKTSSPTIILDSHMLKIYEVKKKNLGLYSCEVRDNNYVLQTRGVYLTLFPKSKNEPKKTKLPPKSFYNPNSQPQNSDIFSNPSTITNSTTFTNITTESNLPTTTNPSATTDKNSIFSDLPTTNSPSSSTSDINSIFSTVSTGNLPPASEPNSIISNDVQKSQNYTENSSNSVKKDEKMGDKNDKVEYSYESYDDEDENMYDEEEEDELKAEDDKNSCKNYINNSYKGPYMCFDYNKKNSEMSHFIVRNAGATLDLYCNVKGKPSPPKVKWFKGNGVFSPNSFKYSIFKNNIRIQDLTTRDSGIYTCTATNGTNNMNYSIRLDVEERSMSKPIFTSAPDNLTLWLGETAIFRIEVLSYPEYGIRWLKHDAIIPNMTTDAKSRTEDETILHDSNVLVLENVTESDEGWYSCIVGNSFGRAVTSSYLTVVTPMSNSIDPYLNSTTEFSDFKNGTVSYGFIILVGVVLFVLLVIILTLSIQVKLKRQRLATVKKMEPLRTLKKVIVERRRADFGEGDEEGILIPEVIIKKIESRTGGGAEYELPIDWAWEFSRTKLAIGRKIGEGAFGDVMIANAVDIIPGSGTLPVAVKCLKQAHKDSDLIDLISEMETLKDLGKHPNIVNLLGCCTQNGELLVIMELCEEGNLKNYLGRNRRNYIYEGPFDPRTIILREGEEILTFKDLVSFAFQVAKGMSFLAQRKYVHRDLAARNVLVCGGKVAKIADFGMSRLTLNDYYRKKGNAKIPMRWMPPETIFHHVYTTQSDVWSYGVLLWEIVTLGGNPYPSISDPTQLLDYLNSGKRMPKPECCPNELYFIMRDCWLTNPSSRPSFNDLSEDVERILKIAAGVEYMDMENGRPFEVYENEFGAIIETPESTPETSTSGMLTIDMELFNKLLEESTYEAPPPSYSQLDFSHHNPYNYD